MKIAVLDFHTSTVDLITVDDDWLENDLQVELSVWYDEEEWLGMSKEDKIEMFIFDYCGYSPSNIHYMVDYTQVLNLTPKDFN